MLLTLSPALPLKVKGKVSKTKMYCIFTPPLILKGRRWRRGLKDSRGGDVGVVQKRTGER